MKPVVWPTNYRPSAPQSTGGNQKLCGTAIQRRGTEHDNLGISYEEKSQLQNENRWLPEPKQRLSFPENK